MATAEAVSYEKETKELSALLRDGPKPLAELPKHLADPDFLAAMIEAGRIEFGRPNHSWEHKPGIAESHAERPRELKVYGDDVRWTALNKNWHKSVYDLLIEEKGTPKEIRLLVRLTRRRVN